MSIPTRTTPTPLGTCRNALFHVKHQNLWKLGAPSNQGLRSAAWAGFALLT